ncbi:MAG: HAD family hydrolase [Clostridia bacterium]|nr:HAD family hydrolase [Clostridia bacterium]
MKNNIIFDLDGTLTESGTGIKNSVRYTLQHYGLPMEDDESLNRYVGPPLVNSFQEYMGFTEQQAMEAIVVYRSYFTTKGMFENRVYDGVEDMLTALKKAGKRMFIATGKPTVYSQQILEHFGLASYFECVCGISLKESTMEKDELITQVLEFAHLTPEECVMIGDRKFDMMGANKVGVTPIGVTYGYGSREELKTAGAHTIVDSVKQLQELLLQ